MRSTEMALRRFAVVGTGILLLSPFSCKKEPEALPTSKPTSAPVTLRVVMVVEPGASLDSLPVKTGGCKLTRNQVTALVDELIAFQDNFCPGLKFEWDRDIVKLEVGCMDVESFFPCLSGCGVITGLNGSCPRRMTQLQFWEWIVNKEANGTMQLVQSDDYVYDVFGPGDRTLNIYFTGHLENNGQPLWGVTVYPAVNTPDFVAMGDGAGPNPSAGARFDWIRSRRTLIHEVGCHWLTEGGDHPVLQQPVSGCPQNVCISGVDAQNYCSDERGCEFLVENQCRVCENRSLDCPTSQTTTEPAP